MSPPSGHGAGRVPAGERRLVSAAGPYIHRMTAATEPESWSSGPSRTFAGIFTLFVVLAAVPLHLARRAAKEPSSFGAALLYGAATWGVWLALAPFMPALGRRWDFRPGRWWRSLMVHLSVVLVAHVVGTAIGIATAVALFDTTGTEPLLSIQNLLRNMTNSTRISVSLLTYAGIVGLDRASRVRQALRARELQAVRLEAQATRARLEALGARLQPHSSSTPSSRCRRWSTKIPRAPAPCSLNWRLVARRAHLRRQR